MPHKTMNSSAVLHDFYEAFFVCEINKEFFIYFAFFCSFRFAVFVFHGRLWSQKDEIVPRLSLIHRVIPTGSFHKHMWVKAKEKLARIPPALLGSLQRPSVRRADAKQPLLRQTVYGVGNGGAGPSRFQLELAVRDPVARTPGGRALAFFLKAKSLARDNQKHPQLRVGKAGHPCV